LNSDLYEKVASIRDIAAVCTLNNKSDIVFEEGKFNKQGEPTEAALKVAAEKIGRFDRSLGNVDYKKNPTPFSTHLRKSVKTVATLDFTSERKTMSTVVKGLGGNQNNCLLLKGAPERVIEKSKNYKREDGTV